MVDNDGNKMPMQLWCYFWDKICRDYNYKKNCDSFVIMVFCSLNHQVERLSLDLRKVMRPLTLDPEKGHTHNFANWFTWESILSLEYMGVLKIPICYPYLYLIELHSWILCGS